MLLIVLFIIFPVTVIVAIFSTTVIVVIFYITIIVAIFPMAIIVAIFLIYNNLKKSNYIFRLLSLGNPSLILILLFPFCCIDSKNILNLLLSSSFSLFLRVY